MEPQSAIDEFDLHLQWPPGGKEPAARPPEAQVAPRRAIPVGSRPTKQQVARAPGRSSRNVVAMDVSAVLVTLDRLVGRLEAMVERLELVQTASTAHVAALDARLTEHIDEVARLGRQVGRFVDAAAGERVR